MFEGNLWILLLVGLALAFRLPVLLFQPHWILHRWLGWHYVLVNDLISNRVSRVYRCHQVGDRLLVRRKGVEFELLQKGLFIEDVNSSWIPLTWSPSSPKTGDPKPKPLQEGLKERRRREEQLVVQGVSSE